jgi:alkylation response protein AidB-like acyl-CoA dehydrogenase
LDLLLSSEDLAFRDEVRRFLADSIPPGMGRAIDLTTAFIVDPDVLIDFHRALHRKGWSVPHWPVEHGGTGWSDPSSSTTGRRRRRTSISRASARGTTIGRKAIQNRARAPISRP